ncbi:hypothetical protein [Kribbella sancticallisti]
MLVTAVVIVRLAVGDGFGAGEGLALGVAVGADGLVDGVGVVAVGLVTEGDVAFGVPATDPATSAHPARAPTSTTAPINRLTMPGT